MNCRKFRTCCYLLCTQVTVLTELFEVVKKAYLKCGFYAYFFFSHFNSFWIRNVSLRGLIQALVVITWNLNICGKFEVRSLFYLWCSVTCGQNLKKMNRK